LNLLAKLTSETTMAISRTPSHRATDHGFVRRWLSPVLLAVAVTATGAHHSAARADDSLLTWIVKSISEKEDSGVVQASTMQMPQEGSALVTGQRISTGGQHMVLVHGRDLVKVSPNTTITIGDNDPTTADANVDVISGNIHVEVGKRAPGQTFSIGAPLLVATVKGTKFDVTTSNEGSVVSVSEGTVAVSATATGKSIDVTVGNSGIVSRGNPGAPRLAPTPAGGSGGLTGSDDDVESASATGNGGNSGNSNSGGSGASGSSGGGATGAVGGAVGGAAGAVGGAVGGATGAIGGGIGGPVGGAVSGAGGAVGGAVSGVGGAVGGAVGGVGGALGGAIGGLGGALGGGK
jgi:FecR protein